MSIRYACQLGLGALALAFGPGAVAAQPAPGLCANPVATTVAASGNPCLGASVTLTATGPAGATYAWSGPNGFGSTQQSPTLPNLTAAAAGTYTVVTSLAGSDCPGTASLRLAVGAPPPVPALTASPATACVGTPITLAATNLAPAALLSEDFTGTAPGWGTASAGAAATSWQYSTGYSYSSAALTLSNYTLNGSRFALANADAGATTATTLTSPVFDTFGYSALQLRFVQRLAYRAGDAATVEVSLDGGASWVAAATYTAPQGTATAPASTTVDLTAYANQGSVRLRWRYASTRGLYWALDDVQLTGTAQPLSYAWRVVSGDGLPAVTTTPTITATPTQPSEYQLTVRYAGSDCLASATIAVAAATATWSGAAGNGNWFDAGNWLNGCLPTRTTDALIPAGLTTPYPVLSAGTAEVRTLTQNGPLTQTGGELAFYGDYLRTGLFTATGGQVSTRRDGPQFITASNFWMLVASGTGLKNVQGQSGYNFTNSVGRSLRMAGAIVQTYQLMLAPTATLDHETDASYVLGSIYTTHQLGTTPDSLGRLGATITAPFAPGLTSVFRETSSGSMTSSISRSYTITAEQDRGLQGATLALAYLPHELNGIAENQLAFFKSIPSLPQWTAEGATTRDPQAHLVSRAYVTSLSGTWTLASLAVPLPPAAVAYTIQAFPVPFVEGGLSVQVRTPTAGPLTVQLYDVLGRRIYDHAVAKVEEGTSTVNLPGTEQLQAGKYLLRVQQATQHATLNVVRQR